jgi:hypothetical protein
MCSPILPQEEEDPTQALLQADRGFVVVRRCIRYYIAVMPVISNRIESNRLSLNIALVVLIAINDY